MTCGVAVESHSPSRASPGLEAQLFACISVLYSMFYSECLVESEVVMGDKMWEKRRLREHEILSHQQVPVAPQFDASRGHARLIIRRRHRLCAQLEALSGLCVLLAQH